MITKFNFTDRSVKSYAIRKLTPPRMLQVDGRSGECYPHHAKHQCRSG